jgi:hypothetical protein
MAEFLKSECARCGQLIEYPAAGTGQTVSCPTCGEPLILAPLKQMAAADVPNPSAPLPTPPALQPPAITQPQIKPPPTQPTPAPPLPKPKSLPPLEQAYVEFAHDRVFAGGMPTREQVARAWALALYFKTKGSRTPTHLELVAALRKLFREFQEPRLASHHPRTPK